MLKILLAILPLTVHCLDQHSFPDCSDLVNLHDPDLGLEEFMFLNEGSRHWLHRPYHYSVQNGSRSVHHVIPASRLRQFYNTAVNNSRNNNAVMPMLGSFLQRMFESTYNRIGVSRMPEHVNPGVFLRAFQNYYQDRSLRVPLAAFHWGHSIVLNLFNWLPGNLFLGPNPQNRSDDPGNRFEEGARHVFDPDQFRRLENADRLITRYIHQSQADYNPDPAVRLEDIISLFDDIVTHSTVYNYDENDWVRNGEKHQINTLLPRDEVKKREVRNDIVDNSPFKIMPDGTCSVTDKAVSYSSTDKIACTITWIALASRPDRVAIDPQYSGTLKSINFKNTRASWFTNNTGLQQDYYLRGKVENVFYNALSGRCWIAMEDAQLQYNNKFHESTDSKNCLTAVGALINDDTVVANAALQLRPSGSHVISKLYIEDQCRAPQLPYMRK